MGFLSNLFGGPERINLLTGGQSQLLNNITGTMNQEFGQAADVYGGQRVAGSNNMINSAFNMMPGAAQMDPAFQQAMTQALSGAGDAAGVENMYQRALQPARTEFNRALNDVASKYGGTWGQNGALPEMLGRATADYGGALNQLLGQLTYNDRQSAANRQVQAIPGALGIEQQQNANLASLFGMGSQQRAMDQQNLMGDYSQWQEGQWYNNPALGFLQPALGTQAYGIGQKQGLLPGIGNMLAGGAKLGQGLMGMFG